MVASTHTGFRQSRERMTARLLSADRNPAVGVIAHPTGRLLGERDPYDADMDAVFREASARGVATARRGWAVAGDVLNTLPCRSLLKRLRSGRKPVAPSSRRNA